MHLLNGMDGVKVLSGSSDLVPVCRHRNGFLIENLV